MSQIVTEQIFKIATECQNTDNGIITVVENYLDTTPETIQSQLDTKPERMYIQEYASYVKLAQDTAYQQGLDNENWIGTENDIIDQVLESQPIDILEKNGQKAQYHVRRLRSNNDALLAYVLTPVHHDDHFNVKVIFQGTDPNSKISLSRDYYEKGGAGSESFAASKEMLLAQVNAVIMKENPPNSGTPTTLTIAGHSLGGADTQNFATAVMEDIVASSEQSGGHEGFANIKALTIVPISSAGITKETAEKSAVLAEKIYQANQQGKMNLSIENYNLVVTGDVVPLTGEAHIFPGIASDKVKINVLEIDGKRAGHSFSSAHTAVLVDANRINAPYRSISNNTPLGLKEIKEVQQKSDVLNNLHKASLLVEPLIRPVANVAIPIVKGLITGVTNISQGIYHKTPEKVGQGSLEIISGAANGCIAVGTEGLRVAKDIVNTGLGLANGLYNTGVGISSVLRNPVGSIKGAFGWGTPSPATVPHENPGSKQLPSISSTEERGLATKVRELQETLSTLTTPSVYDAPTQSPFLISQPVFLPATVREVPAAASSPGPWYKFWR